MTRAVFDTYVKTQLTPRLAPGDVVTFDTLSAHKFPTSQAVLKAQGNGLLFLSPYSPDPNPIEMALSKRKAHLGRLKARTLEDLWRVVGSICDGFDPNECWNHFRAAGYAQD